MDIAKNATIEKNNCHDCDREIIIEEKEIKNGVLLKYDDAGKETEIFKCQECFQKSHSLTNFRPCEVYSRVVGYLRPVQQWNTGKQGEFQDRKEYKLTKECS